MAARRMFAFAITSSDAFLDMPLSAQALYFHLCLSADDDGFVNCANKVRKMIEAPAEDMKLLEDKHFFEPCVWLPVYGTTLFIAGVRRTRVYG